MKFAGGVGGWVGWGGGGGGGGAGRQAALLSLPWGKACTGTLLHCSPTTAALIDRTKAAATNSRRQRRQRHGGGSNSSSSGSSSSSSSSRRQQQQQRYQPHLHVGLRNRLLRGRNPQAPTVLGRPPAALDALDAIHKQRDPGLVHRQADAGVGGRSCAPPPLPVNRGPTAAAWISGTGAGRMAKRRKRRAARRAKLQREHSDGCAVASEVFCRRIGGY